MNIKIHESSNIPIYEQIINQFKDGIINMELMPDSPLPSIRALAKELQISVITTKRAYEELESEGLVYSKPGRGFFVSPKKAEMLKEKKIQMIEDELLKLIKTGAGVGLTRDDFCSLIEELWDYGG